MSTAAIRRATPHDLDDILRICAASPSAPQWAAELFRGMLSAPSQREGLSRILLAVEYGGQLAGFAAVSALVAVFPVEAELESIAVDPVLRGQRIGAALMEGALAWAGQQRATLLRLEVRTGNHPARRLYAAAGLVETGVRRNYYDHPTEDAVLMEIALDRLR